MMAAMTSSDSENRIFTQPHTSSSPSSSYSPLGGGCPPVDPDNVHETVRHYALAVLSPVVLLTNMAVLVAVLSAHRVSRRPDLFLIASLCCADMLVGGACIAAVVTRAREATLGGCLVRVGLSLSAVQASIFCLMAVACDRLLAISMALRYKQLVTTRRLALSVLCLWSVALVVGLLPYLGWNRGEGDGDGEGSYGGYCSFLLVLPASYVATSFVFCLLPIAAILFIHAYLYACARVIIRRIDTLERVVQNGLGAGGSGGEGCGGGGGHHRKSSSLGLLGLSGRTIRTVSLVAGCVLACWCPFLLTSLYAMFVPRAPCFLNEVVGTHLLVLGYVNSALNPVVYAMRNKEIRAAAATALTAATRICKRGARGCPPSGRRRSVPPPPPPPPTPQPLSPESAREGATGCTP